MLFNILQFLDDYKISYRTKGANVGKGWVGIQCPFCGDTGFHGGFNIAGGYYYCWKCGSHHLNSVIAKLAPTSFPTLQKYESHNFHYIHTEKSAVTDVQLPGDDLLPMHKLYLKKRGFSPEYLIDTYKIRGGGYTGEWKYRIIIPIYQKKILTSFQARAIHPSVQPRYKTLSTEKSIIDAKHSLYNIDNVHGDRVVVVEGIFDCWKLGNGCVCTLGTSVTDEQIRLLAQFKEVVFLFDPEGPAQEKAKYAAQKVACLGASVEVVDTEWGHDPGDFTMEEIEYIRKELRMEA